MALRRVPPLPVALALVALALVAAAWTTRRTVVDAHAAVRDGQAISVFQEVRAELADLGGRPSSDQLEAIVRDRAPDGLRYLAVLEGREVGAEAGQARVANRPLRRTERGGIAVAREGSRVRIEVPVKFRRAWGPPSAPWRIALEVEPSQAIALRTAATRTLAVGALAAVLLLAIAIWLVRGELRRRADEQRRERERRLASLGEMSAVLAHEIRNPLASLKGNAQLLAASLPEGEKPRAKADRVVDEAVRLERLSQDLLAFVRTGELTRTQADVASVVRDAAAAVTAGAVEVDVSRAPVVWSLDTARMHQVVVNLLENAVAAGPPARLEVRTERERLVIEVSDRGPGIAPEDRDRIFEPFFTKKTRGTGLGLAIARRVVELHGGTIAVGDAPGGGARFRIEIPDHSQEAR